MPKKFVLGAVLSLKALTGYAGEHWTLETQHDSWHAQWDFNARPLTTADGMPSKIGWLIQPRIHRLDVFGSVGRFSGTQGVDVGFAQITHLVSMARDLKQMILRGYSRHPSTKIKFIVVTKQSGPGNYQADIPLDTHVQTFTFEPADFAFYVRGRLVPNAPIVNFDDVQRVGFLVTRSSQGDGGGESIPFDFSLLLGEAF